MDKAEVRKDLEIGLLEKKKSKKESHIINICPECNNQVFFLEAGFLCPTCGYSVETIFS